MIPDLLKEAVEYLGVFGTGGLLLTDRSFSQTIQGIISAAGVNYIRHLHVQFAHNALELRAEYYNDHNVLMRELVRIDAGHIEEMLPLLFRYTSVGRCFVAADVSAVLPRVLRVLAGLGRTFMVAEKLRMDCSLYANAPALRTFVNGIAKNEVIGLDASCCDAFLVPDKTMRLSANRIYCA